MSYFKKTAGFTLIELMIVLFIVAVLIAIGAVSYTTILKKNRDTQRKTHLREIQTALEKYYANNDSYPIANGGLIDCSGTIDWGDPFTCGGTDYLSQLPKDPVSSKNYHYDDCGSNQNYVIFAQLESNVGETLPVLATFNCPAVPDPSYNYWVLSK